MKTIPFDLIFNFMLGLFIPYVARDRLRKIDTIFLNKYFGAVLLVAVAIMAPVGYFIFAYYPDWSMMYFVNPAGAHPYLKFVVVGMYIFANLLGYITGQSFVKQHRDKLALGLLITLGLVLGAFSAINAKRFYFLTGFRDYQDGVTQTIFSDWRFVVFLVLSTAVFCIVYFFLVRHFIREGNSTVTKPTPPPKEKQNQKTAAEEIEKLAKNTSGKSPSSG